MGKKNKNDKFYTKENIAIDLIKLLDLSRFKTVIECSAGNGSFSNNTRHDNLIALDIEPENDNIIKMDWFNYNESHEDLLIISNPPFGIRNNLSKAFIRHSIKLGAKTIAFILPNVYNKYTLQSVFPKEYKLSTITPLPKNSFSLDGEDYDIPCSFYIWDKESDVDLRFNIDLYKTGDFEFVPKKLADESCIFILGASINTVKSILNVEDSNRGYYIKPKEKTKLELINIFSKLKYSSNSCVNGKVAWMTKPEIIKSYIERDLDE